MRRVDSTRRKGHRRHATSVIKTRTRPAKPVITEIHPIPSHYATTDSNACTAASCRGRDGRRVSAPLARARRASRGAGGTSVARRAVPRAAACDRLRPCLARRALEQVREHVGPERLTVLLTQHACALQVPMPLQRIRESGRHRDVPHAIAMTSRPAWSAWSSTRARPSAPWRATWT